MARQSLGLLGFLGISTEFGRGVFFWILNKGMLPYEDVNTRKVEIPHPAYILCTIHYLKFRNAHLKIASILGYVEHSSDKRTPQLIQFFTIGISVRLSDRSLHREEQKKNSSKIAPNGVWNQDLWIFRPTPYWAKSTFSCQPESSWPLESHALLILEWTTCEVVHETNKAHFRNLLSNRFLPSSVGKTLAWRSGGSGFNPHWGQFLMIFFCSSLCKDLSDNLTETPIVKNSSVMLSLTNGCRITLNQKWLFITLCVFWA